MINKTQEIKKLEIVCKLGMIPKFATKFAAKFAAANLPANLEVCSYRMVCDVRLKKVVIKTQSREILERLDS